MRKPLLWGLVAALITGLSGCASIVSGTNQPLTVETRSKGALVSGATCKLVNDKGTWYVTTPGSVTVHRSGADLALSCEKDGAPPGKSTVKSSTKPMAFGNAIFGGVIGVGVDVVSGAAFDYPDLIQVEISGLADALLTTTTLPSPALTSSVAPSVSSPATLSAAAPAPSQLQAGNPMPSPAYPHTLSAEELASHFQRYSQFEVEAERVAFLLKIRPGGKVERDCVSCKIQYGDGTLEIKPDQGLACFKWNWVTYPASGCYSVVQTASNAFSLEDAAAKQRYSYSVPH